MQIIWEFTKAVVAIGLAIAVLYASLPARLTLHVAGDVVIDQSGNFRSPPR